jgi:LysM repeat protein
MNIKKMIIWGGALTLIAAALAVAPSASRAQSGNLLVNPGMNLPYTDGNKQPNGWGRWFQVIEKPNDASALQYALNPNFSAETNPSGQHPELVPEGDAAAHIGRQYDPWIGGLSQAVSNIPAGSQVRFCANSRVYAQNRDYGKGDPSVSAMNARSQVGLFQDGDATWDNPNIKWSGTANPHDTWGQLCVEGTVGASGKVVVFTRNDWRGSGAIHLDSWWDNAELVTLGAQPTAQPTTAAQPQPQPQQPQTQPQQPAAQPDAGGGIMHTIAAGDTLFGLSLQYNVPLDTIYALNGLNSQSILSIGQKVIIKAGTGTTVPAAQPTAASQPTAAPTTEPAPAAGEATPQAPTEATPQTQPAAQPTVAVTAVAAASDKGTLCLFAYDDVNADALRDPGEGPVAGATFIIIDGQGATVSEYVSTNTAEAHCISDLTPGSYSVNVQPAPQTVPTSDERFGVPLTPGSKVNIDFGSRAGEGNATASSNGSESSSTSSGGSNIGGIVAGIGGLVLLLAAGVIGAFVIARRRA